MNPIEHNNLPRKCKPTNYQAAKLLTEVGEDITSQMVIERLISTGRKEIITKRSLSARMKQGMDFIVVLKTSRGPTVFRRVA